MTIHSKKSKAHEYSSVLKITGSSFFLVWPAVIAPFAGHLFFCGIMSSNPCPDSGNFSDILALGPTILGAFLFALGLFYNSKFERSLKLFAITTLTVALSFAAYWYTLLWWWIRGILG